MIGFHFPSRGQEVEEIPCLLSFLTHIHERLVELDSLQDGEAGGRKGEGGLEEVREARIQQAKGEEEGEA